MNIKNSFLSNTEISSIEQLYDLYKKNPDELDESWIKFFQGFEFSQAHYDTFKKQKPFPETQFEAVEKEFQVGRLIHDYRHRGHFFTKTNPVRKRRRYFPTLDIENYGLSKSDLDTTFQAGKQIGIGPAKLRDIIDFLKQTYCQSIGVEFISVRKPELVDWLQARMEKVKNTPSFSAEEQKDIYNLLKVAVGFEKFIHKKFPGQKRFSLEGAEALIPALDAVIEHGAELGTEEFIIGMAHRGRLNVLANILQKPYENIFQEFIGKQYDAKIALGDVKYHLGYGQEITTKSGKKVRLNLAPNPSHLEMVDSIIQGIARAKIIHKYGKDYSKAAPIIVHGDAAIAGQGIVYEIIQMSQLKGYKTGGTIHLVINNQVGFTTNYIDARSSTYCTDVARVTRSPVFHVNGDDVEALVYIIKLALEFRQRFRRDIFIDILCYRKYGHNEGDEPRFTQPTLYKAISKQSNTRDIYGQSLVQKGIFSEEDLKTAEKDFNDILETKLELSKEKDKVHIKQFLEEDWRDFKYPEDNDFKTNTATGQDIEILKGLAVKMNQLPQDKPFFKKIYKIADMRLKMIENNTLDWGLCELLAYASLLIEKKPVRISGQDSQRGTFAHRHATFVLKDMDEEFIPLQNIDAKQASFTIYNSPLSEYGLLGFEYGYALAEPKGLTIWEAQFGDFVNVAQPITDQYISSGEEKWGLMNGLVMYLPHGYEGQGPEHSSARLERFLMMAVNNNMQIVNCTTPANLFHVLRRQVHRDFRVPLVIFSPKSLLRHPKCISTFKDLSNGGFNEVIDDPNVDVDDVTRLVFCSGKIYYDLYKRKEELNVRNIAIVRIEQLHPFPFEKVKEIADKYNNKMLTLWVQEEPENMGAWPYINKTMSEFKLINVARLPSGSPATGLYELHEIGQKEIIDKVFRKCTCELKNVYCGLQCVKGRSRKEILKQHYYL
jgi:2-oxoglutarate dehydrogenase E1 component